VSWVRGMFAVGAPDIAALAHIPLTHDTAAR